MKDTCLRLLLKSVALATITFPLLACNSLGGAFGTFSYPPDFSHVEGEELGSRMQQLGYELQQLDQVLASAHDERTDLQQNVVNSLRSIERIAGNLRSDDLGASHPFFTENLTELLADTRQAREAAASNPPMYYMAGRVSGACVNCHRVVR